MILNPQRPQSVLNAGEFPLFQAGGGAAVENVAPSLRAAAHHGAVRGGSSPCGEAASVRTRGVSC